jgi:hypothetical protein
VRPLITLIEIKEKEDGDLQSLYTPGNDRNGCGLEPSSSSPYGIRASPSSAPSSGDPRTREAALLRAGSPQAVWSPAAREAAAVRQWRWMGVVVSRREREKGKR